jgi:hypothetical protein
MSWTQIAVTTAVITEIVRLSRHWKADFFEVAEIARLLKVREKEVHDGESEDKNKEEDKLFQCCSADEGGATTEVDSDDE